MKVTKLFKKHFYMLLYKSMCPLFAYSQNVKLKNLISNTEAAPKEHHDRGMSGWVVGGESGDSFLRLKSGHRHWQCLFSQLSSAEILNGIGLNTLAYIYIYTYSHTHVNASAKVKTRHIMQKPVHKLQLLVFALTILHITFSTKARHFRVRGRYVLDRSGG